MNKNIFYPNDDEHLKCAPSKKYSDGSCFTIESLLKIAHAYNKYVGTNAFKYISTENVTKKELVNDLTKAITECSGDQLCWLNQKWIADIVDNDIHKNTFRPLGPQGRFEWLSTTNINDIVKQYENKYVNFKFLGAVPYDFENIPIGISNLNFDELMQKNKTQLGMVINLDEHYKKGSHWVGLYFNLEKYCIFFFDSCGFKPKKKICNFIKRIAMWMYHKYILNSKFEKTNIEYEKTDTESIFMTTNKNKYEKIFNIDYNKNRHQFKDSECGVYSVNFILRLLNGETFDEICQNITSDDKINECRKVYFRFK